MDDVDDARSNCMDDDASVSQCQSDRCKGVKKCVAAGDATAPGVAANSKAFCAAYNIRL